jgi:site-specific recombinase XerD
VREEWNRAAAKVGVRCRMYEGTKHTFATNLLEAGVSQEVIQAVLRHRDRRSTERYAKLSLAAAVRLLPRHNSDGICGPLVARD